MNRPMTNEEKIRFRGYFPKLDTNRSIVTDNATAVYNCIAWTVKITSSWIWPGDNIMDFDAFYNRHGFVRSEFAPGSIAAWGVSSAQMTHGSVLATPGTAELKWESKCGSDLRILHKRDELECLEYGEILFFYKLKTTLADDKFASIISKINDTTQGDFMKLENEIEEQLRVEIKSVPEKTRVSFDKIFCEWQKTWGAEEFKYISNPSFARLTKPYQNLVAMGDQILPLLIEKLLNPNNFFALQLYDSLQSNKKLIVYLDPAADEILEGEQGRARRTVLAWLKK